MKVLLRMSRVLVRGNVLGVGLSLFPSSIGKKFISSGRPGEGRDGPGIVLLLPMRNLSGGRTFNLGVNARKEKSDHYFFEVHFLSAVTTSTLVQKKN